MSDAQGRTTELEISEVVLDVLYDNGVGRATFRNLIREIPRRIALTNADLGVSETRPNECVWEQRVRNISSHRRAEGNYVSEGFLIKINGGLQITEAGRRRVAGRRV